MSVLKFEKYQGAGDNFIFVDNRDGIYDDILANTKLVKKMCDRNMGIGANGLIEMRKHEKYPFEMVFHTSEGIVGQMCGNGGRICLRYATTTAALVKDNEEIKFHVHIDGEHTGRFDVSQQYGFLSMRDIPNVHKLSDNLCLADSGLTHLVVFVDRPLEKINVVEEGHELSETWSQYGRPNSPVLVNFVKVTDDGLYARCYDTFGLQEIVSCGTATTAIAVCYAVKKADNDVQVEDGEQLIRWGGGDLKVKFHREQSSFSKIQLCGAVCHVFSGTYAVEDLVAVKRTENSKDSTL